MSRRLTSVASTACSIMLSPCSLTKVLELELTGMTLELELELLLELDELELLLELEELELLLELEELELLLALELLLGLGLPELLELGLTPPWLLRDTCNR